MVSLGEKHREIYLLSIRQDKGRSEPGYAHPTDNKLNYVEVTLWVTDDKKTPADIVLHDAGREAEDKYNFANESAYG